MAATVFSMLKITSGLKILYKTGHAFEEIPSLFQISGICKQ